MPGHPLPIIVIGAGGIVKDAHLPAYKKAGFPVDGIFDVNRGCAEDLARKFSIPQVFDSIEEVAAQTGVFFDVAVPPEHIYSVLEKLPEGAPVLTQKPMGMNLEDARRIREICREKRLISAINFQLRFSPMMLVIRDAIAKGWLGELTDVEVRLHLRTRWELFPFLKNLDRVEIQTHSIHYLDWIRSILGEPRGVYARTLKHPKFQDLKNTKSTIILDYGDMLRCALSLNHTYENGGKHDMAQIFVEGLKGSAVVTLGLLLNYPAGIPEAVEITTEGCPPTEVPLQGQWFPDAFIGRMANLQRYVAGEDAELVSSTDDAYKTMALVEACYESNARGSTPIPL